MKSQLKGVFVQESLEEKAQMLSLDYSENCTSADPHLSEDQALQGVQPWGRGLAAAKVQIMFMHPVCLPCDEDEWAPACSSTQRSWTAPQAFLSKGCNDRGGQKYAINCIFEKQEWFLYPDEFVVL